jgi:hypothetical protein
LQVLNCIDKEIPELCLIDYLLTEIMKFLMRTDEIFTPPDSGRKLK